MSRRCEARVREIAELSVSDLVEYWARERGTSVPAISPSLLARDLAHTLQVETYGGLDPRLERHLQRLCRAAEEAHVPQRSAEPPSPASSEVQPVHTKTGKRLPNQQIFGTPR